MLAELVQLLPESVPAQTVGAMRRVADLTPWALSGRYPGAAELSDKPPTLQGVETAISDLEVLQNLVRAAAVAGAKPRLV